MNEVLENRAEDRLLPGGSQDDGEEEEYSHDGSLSLYTLLIVGCSCIGGLMFGYDSAIVSGLLLLIGEDLGHDLSTVEKEVVTSITSVGALLGSIAAGIFGDRIGRKGVITASCFSFVVSALVMAFARDYTTLVVGRLLAGMSIGGASTSVPVYIAEVAPPRHRGKLVTLNSVCTTGGQVVAYASGLVFQSVASGWRWMLAISAVPPAIFLLCAAFIPESPRWLINHGHTDQAEEALAKLYPDIKFSDIQALVSEQSDRAEQESHGHNRLRWLFTVKSNLRALIVACGLMAAQQLCGINVFMYYSPTIFKTIGFEDPLLVSMIVACTNFAFSFVPVLYVDRLGRRTLLLSTVWIMVVALFVTGWAFESGGASIVVASTFVYIASYSSAMGNVPWQAVEFLPLNVRSVGSMMVSSTNWVTNTLVSLTFLTFAEKSVFATFSGYAIITLAAYIGIYYCYPEVSGISLEHIPAIFNQPIYRLGQHRTITNI
ncbi:myo-inositol transporter 1 [Trichomonascus vanleenenianus]|uniref:myo-inositol transporter 1 n=1 Tax=Trichomonascus vanleenenianus TaxID=2268995 RepID=UPI003EC9898A